MKTLNCCKIHEQCHSQKGRAIRPRAPTLGLTFLLFAPNLSSTDSKETNFASAKSYLDLLIWLDLLLSLKPILQLRFDYDTTTIWRYHDAFNYDMRSIRLRYDYNRKLTCSFLLGSNWKQARAIRRSRIAVMSLSCRSRIAIVIMA